MSGGLFRSPPDRSDCRARCLGWAQRGFLGYYPAPMARWARVNYWLVLPLVFCENRNVERMREALEEELGYGSANSYRRHVRQLIDQRANGDVSRKRLRIPRGAYLQ